MRNTYPPRKSLKERIGCAKTRPYALHQARNPSGAKFIRQAYRNKFGVKETYAKSLAWYKVQQ